MSRGKKEKINPNDLKLAEELTGCPVEVGVVFLAPRLLTERPSGNGVRGATRGRRTSKQALSSAPGPPPEGAGGES